jgi:exonuclease III
MIDCVPSPHHYTAANCNSSISELNVLSCNFGGRLQSDLLHSQFCDLLENIHLLCAQETHLYPDEVWHPPDYYTMFSQPRPTDFFDDPWGGVATFVRADLHAHLWDDLCGPDVVTVEVEGILFINAYVLPRSTRTDWSQWTDVHPWDALKDICTRAATLNKPFFLLGDLNARTASRSPKKPHPSRSSPDSSWDVRGTELLNLCESLDMTVLNGSEGIPGTHTRWTSFQKRGLTYATSVVDYAICSMSCVPNIASFDISPRTDWADHALSSLSILLPRNTLPSRLSSKRKQ